MSNELKDCPFCGREPEQSERADNNTITGRAYFIACMCGGYSANAHQFGETKEQVTRKWNCRPIAPVASAAPSGELPPLPEPLEINWPNLNRNALGCGVEDRSIHCRYDAAEYGWQDGVDRAIECVPDAIFDADQVQEYARAAIAASAPNKQLVEALKASLAVIDDYLEYEHNGDPWVEDARAMGEMDIDDYARDGRRDAAIAALAAAGVEPLPQAKEG